MTKESKYFTKKEKHLLSEYLERKEEDYLFGIVSYENRVRRTKYLMSFLGDIALDEKMYDLYIKQYQIYGGRYDVRTNQDTYKGITSLITKYPDLSAEALDELWGRYIKDLFEEYSLDEVLEKFIEVFGETDEAFLSYLDLIDRKAEEHQKQYEEEAKLTEEIKGEYSDSLISHIESLIKRRHFKYEDIKKCLPEASLMKKDEEHILDVSRQTRIFFGCCEAVSHTMMDYLLEDGHLDDYSEQPAYYINQATKVPATFTKEEFLSSIKKHQELSAAEKKEKK